MNPKILSILTFALLSLACGGQQNASSSAAGADGPDSRTCQGTCGRQACGKTHQCSGNCGQCPHRKKCKRRKAQEQTAPAAGDAPPAQPALKTANAAELDLTTDANPAPESAVLAWSAWRGRDGSGFLRNAQPPVKWDEQTNIRWKLDVPGLGHSTPVVMDGRIFLTTAVPTERKADPEAVDAAMDGTPEFVRRRGARKPEYQTRFVVMAVDLDRGNVLWARTARTELPGAPTHNDGSWASPSPCTDGARVYAYFGSHGLYCLDTDGQPVWEKDLGDFDMKANFGEGASPALAGDLLIVNQDHEGQSFIVALDKRTGEEKWRKLRDERTSWSTPLVVKHDGRTLAVVSATNRIRAYDMEGNVVWSTGGMTGNVIPHPVPAGGLVICMSGFRGNAARAIDLNRAAGDMTADHPAIVWTMDGHTPYTPSPIVANGLLYFLERNDGKLSCADARTGTLRYGTQALEGIDGVYSSPVAAGGHVYVPGQEGKTAVVAMGPRFELIATNQLDDKFTASPAVVGGALLLRGHDHLYCIASDQPDQTQGAQAQLPEDREIIRDPAVENFIRALREGGFHAGARAGDELFKTGAYIPNHAEVFERFEHELLEDGRIRYDLFQVSGDGGAASISLFLDQKTGRIVEFRVVNASM